MALRHFVLALLVCCLTAAAFGALRLPPNLAAEATGPNGAVVTYSAGADGSGDDENGRPIDQANCAPASGATFPLGTTTVNCSATTGETGSFQVTVSDTSGPSLHLPRDFTVPGTSQGATVTYSATAEDAVDGAVSVSCSPASGTAFPVGTTTVQCTAGDSRQNTSAGSFAVTVTVQQPPPPPPPLNDITVEATGPYGAVVTFNTTGDPGDQDDENGRPVGNCSPASGSTFPIGSTTVLCSNGTFQVHVVDTTAPVLSLSASPNELWPPNGKLVPVTISASVQDSVDASPLVGVYDVTCNETITGDDWNVVSPLTVELRADRSPHGSGRVYTIWVEAIDSAGNRSVSSVNVTVPHDQGTSGGATTTKQWRGIRRDN